MDLHTLHIEHAVLLAVYTLLTLVNARMHKGIRGIYWFSLYNTLLFAGALLVSVRGHVPDFLSIVIGNLFVVSGYIALFVSLAKFFGTRLHEICVQLAIATFAIGAMLEYGWFHPDTNKRLLAYSLVLFAQQAHIALFTARKERRHTHAAVSMSVILASLALMNALRISTLLFHSAPQDYLTARGALVWMVLANTALQCGAIVSYVWMSASLLRGDLALQASTDPLTGLLNRRAMDCAAQIVLADCPAGQLTAAIAIDLNEFKGINDSFGHGCGDAILIAVSRTLELGLRNSDFIGRMGGDEFLALLPRTSAETANDIARKLDAAIRTIAVPHGEASICVSGSFGVAEVPGPGADWGRLLIECDGKLYEAKKQCHQLVTAGSTAETILEEENALSDLPLIQA